MLLILANRSYEFRQPFDLIGVVVFLILWAIDKPEITFHRFLAFCLVAFDAYLMFNRPLEPVGMLLFPLALIWFSDLLGGMRGMVGHCSQITAETPGWMVAGFGWIVLLVISGRIMYECFGATGAS